MWDFQETLMLLKDTDTLLAAWEADPLLVKRISGDLVVVNASKRLFSPTTIEQTLAKGVVYNKNTREILSVPFPKMWNYEENPEFHKPYTSKEYELQILAKEDGTLIQSFWVGDEIHLCTRGSMLGTHDESSDHLTLAYKLWEMGAHLLIEHPKDLTLIWEMVGPNNPIIQPYSEDKLVLIGAFCHRTKQHLPHSQLLNYSSQTAENLTSKFQYDLLPRDMEGVEGWVVAAIKDGVIHHAFKIKTSWWRQQMRSKCTVTSAEVLRRFLADDSILFFEDLWAQLMLESGQEELKEDWRKVWDETLPKMGLVLSTKETIRTNLKFLADTLENPQDAKMTALAIKANDWNIGLHMAFWRDKGSRIIIARHLNL